MRDNQDRENKNAAEESLSQNDPNEQINSSNKPSTKLSLMPWVCTSFAIIFGLIGMVFGIVSSVDNNNKTEKVKYLQSRIDKLEASIHKTENARNNYDDYDDDEEESEEIETETGTEAEVSANKPETKPKYPIITVADRTSNYIYVSEWGIKIKLPDNLDAMNYRFSPQTYDEEQGYTSGSLCIGGVKDLGDREIPSFWEYKGGCVTAGKGTDEEKGHWIGRRSQAQVVVDGLYFWVEGPNAMNTVYQDEEDWEYETSMLILETLRNPDNYSKI